MAATPPRLSAAERLRPFGWWVGWQGSEQAIFDVCDCIDKMQAAFAGHTRDPAERVAAVCERLHPDEIRCGATSSTSCISPSTYLRYNLPHIEKVTAVAKDYGAPTNLHL